MVNSRKINCKWIYMISVTETVWRWFLEVVHGSWAFITTSMTVPAGKLLVTSISKLCVRRGKQSPKMGQHFRYVVFSFVNGFSFACHVSLGHWYQSRESWMILRRYGLYIYIPIQLCGVNHGEQGENHIEGICHHTLWESKRAIEHISSFNMSTTSCTPCHVSVSFETTLRILMIINEWIM